jgi:peptidyl-prolyl cis-trans isomerase D
MIANDIRVGFFNKQKGYIMLESMRKAAKNVFVKGFLLILASSFIIWGVGDMFRGRTSDTVATVGDNNISYNEFRNRLQSEISRYQQFFGLTLTETQIEQYGLKSIILNQMIDDKMLDQHAVSLNLKVGGDVVKDQLSANKMFFDDSGKFSPELFDDILKRNGINKNDYVELIKQDMVKGLLIDTLSSTPSSLSYATDAMYAYQNQERDFEALVIESDYIKNVNEPSDTDLVQFYQENTEHFSLPEVRGFTYFKYTVNDILNEVKISPEAIKEAYESNLTEYQDPEKRDIEQYLFDTEADALKALESLKAGKIADYSDKKTIVGEIDLAGLPDNIGKVVFNMETNIYSQPTKTELGWHIFKVNKIILSTTKSFDDVKASIQERLKEEKAAEIFYESATQIEDSLAAGSTLEDVSKKFNANLHKVDSVDNSGSDISGKILSDIADPKILTPLVFSGQTGEISPMTLLEDNLSYIIVRVDSISPKRTKALDEVKGTAIKLWKEKQQAVELGDLAAKVAKRLADGEDINKVAASMKIKVKKFNNVKRPGSDSSEEVKLVAPYELIEDIFAKQIGQSSESYITDDGDYMIAKLKFIKEAKNNEDKKNELREVLKAEFAEDILEQFRIYLHETYPVKTYEALINSSNP